MNSYYLLVVLISLSAAFAYINHRFIKMPFVIGLFFLTTLLSLVVWSSKMWDFQHYIEIKGVLEHVNLSEAILKIMLGFLLFAGALHTNWGNIRSQLKTITLFAVGGVILSTLLVAGMLHVLCQAMHIEMSMLHCLLFGALISPTDPIAVLGILKQAGVSKKIESTIVGESLFNDGVGVVVFIALLETLNLGQEKIDFGHFGFLFLQEAVGGAIFGLVLGFALHALLRSIDNFSTEVLLTIAFVMLGYALSNYFHLSGALAMVIMGLLVGNYKQEKAMSNETHVYITKFWELIDVILNGILFISIAFVLVVVDFESRYLLLGGVSILIVLVARMLVVLLPRLLLPRFTNITAKEGKLIVWGGLRGGLSIALVLSLPESQEKEVLMVVTYICVVFSIMVQGLTIGKLAKRLG